MSRKFIFSFCLLSLAAITAKSQTKKYDLPVLFKTGQMVTTPVYQTQVLENTLSGAIATKGIVWLKTIRFTQGTIDVDLRGKNVFLQSFLGIAFHAPDTSAYDLLYFRPFNFRHADTARRRWSVAYVTYPDHPWEQLRKDHPRVYENAITPAPDPANWFHATIVVKDGWISVYVNHANQASLKVHLLNDRQEGMIGLWDDELSGDFANLTISQ